VSDEVKSRTTPVTPRGINHLVLNVRDMEASHHFWCELLGFVQVGELQNLKGGDPLMNMRFYSGVIDGVNHHDLALVEREGLGPVEEWNMVSGRQAMNHVAITYPDRESWREQMKFLRDNGVKLHSRLDHGMTHSLYVSDPDGYGVEVLYELPREVWEGDIDAALSWAQGFPIEELLEDNTDYVTDFRAS